MEKKLRELISDCIRMVNGGGDYTYAITVTVQDILELTELKELYLPDEDDVFLQKSEIGNYIKSRHCIAPDSVNYTEIPDYSETELAFECFIKGKFYKTYYFRKLTKWNV